MTAAFASLAVPNYRRYFAGQVISVSGNWMQIVAEAWLVLRLSSSGLALGIAAALQFLPLLLVGAWGGVLADRFPKRRVLFFTQFLMAIPALTLFVLASTGSATLLLVYALIFTRGCVTAIDNPARQSFVSEMVGPDRIVNAVSLNSVLIQTARVAGPAAAAVVIATAGVATCFLLNSLTFAAMLFALWRMDPKALQTPKPAARGRGQVREAFRYVWGTPELRIPMLAMAMVGTISFNFPTVLPLLAKFTFHGGPGTYAAMTGVMGVGAIIGALVNGARGRTGRGIVAVASLGFGVGLAAAAAAPTLVTAIPGLLLTGFASVTFSASINSQLQLAAPAELRGRVMALYAVVFLGSTPIGAPLIGWLSEVSGPRAGLLAGAVAAVVAGLGALLSTHPLPARFPLHHAGGRSAPR